MKYNVITRGLRMAAGSNTETDNQNGARGTWVEYLIMAALAALGIRLAVFGIDLASIEPPGNGPYELLNDAQNTLHDVGTVASIGIAIFGMIVAAAASAACLYLATWWWLSWLNRRASTATNPQTDATENATVKAALIAVPPSIVLIGAIAYCLFHFF